MLCCPVAGYGENTTDPTKFKRGPQFTIEPEDQIYDKDGVNNYTVMECRATSNPDSTSKWYIRELVSQSFAPLVALNLY